MRTILELLARVRFAVARIRAIDGSNFESGRHKTENIFAETVDISMIKYIAFRG